MVDITSWKMCSECKVFHKIQFNGTVEEFNECKSKWKDGALIQQAFPMLSIDQREILLTGTCQKAWDQLFKDE